MPNPLVAVTDHVFPDLEPTKAALASVGAEVNLARSGSAEDILDVARGADAVINCFAQLPGDVIKHPAN